ncbi:SnoaL-like domain-containing protein [Cupriavidus sp. YR651]|uniref:nuclear transport factor 2 family protein n=1 Tax=Cupriavidus sp. YR651 TaxID=1855315 RepID=UPI00087F4F81|nr:nuclear transport factor 2 family protein [Cupriavidus sp. YR651]SDD93040.1 SnoaL-like domain-containing protein [Cupriavidus sp. YR651]
MSQIETVETFFARYRAHDIKGMLSLFAPGARIDYVPIMMAGPVGETGRSIWSTLIDGFPDLSNRVTAIYSDDDQRTVIAEVTISGTQARDVLGIANRGQSFSLPHVFIARVDSQARIEFMRAYWDNATLYAALSHAES